jgi:hypothetical protein
MTVDTGVPQETEESSEMSEAYLTNWSLGSDWTERNDRFHETALAEARVATEYRDVEPGTKAHDGLLARLRLAFAGQPATTEACSCPA